QQRTGETILEIGRDEAADVIEIVPDRALEQILLQRRKRSWAEQVIEADGASVVELVGKHVAIRALAEGAPGQFRSTPGVDGGVVVLADDVDLRVGERDRALRDVFGNLFVVPRQNLEPQPVAQPLRQVAELLRIVQQLVTRRRGERLAGNGGAVVAAAQLV